ncbi:MAG TPA: lipid-binding SYLF domain-containing protein [Alphaproteobacteria bacterium]|nr:hypothetical protein [Rhodospirillaceae bacterium]HRJ12682.1 lipid-binding SYLF domain-containing protein [Alphaproteobacteria bacterium]
MIYTRWIFALLLLPLLGCASDVDRDMIAQRTLVNESAATVSRLLADPQFAELKDYIHRSKAVLVIPNMYRAGFVFGAEYGNAVLMVKTSGGDFQAAAPINTGTNYNAAITTEDLGSGQTMQSAPMPIQTFSTGVAGWGNPIFYQLTGGSAGLQIGAQSAEIVITIMTDKGLEGLLNNSFKMGADASVAFGPIGKNIAAGTTLTPPSADMYTFGSTMGLYGGASLSGSVLKENANWNMLVYGSSAKPREVMLRSDTQLTEAQSLRDALSR